MRRPTIGLGALFLAGSVVATTETAGSESAWSRARMPKGGPALAVGGYSAGCIQGAQELPVSGEAHRVMKPERHRNFGHPNLVDYVTQLSAKMALEKLEPLGVGDLGQARGGPAPNGHASHQNGLDVDLWFAPGQKGSEQHAVVNLELRKRSEHWSERVPKMLELAAKDPRVSRIFVNALIKRELCESTTGDRSWLRKLRPWWGHYEHFHVRLHCPEDSPECQAQPPTPAGDGCEELDWWLSAETAKERSRRVKSYSKRVGSQPKLPETCNKIAR